MFATNIDAETTDEKVQALLDYLNEENGTKLKKRDIKIEEQPYSKSGALYHTPFGTYNVLTDSESYDAAYQRINDIWDDLGLESFTPNAQIYIILLSLQTVLMNIWKKISMNTIQISNPRQTICTAFLVIDCSRNLLK